MGERPRKGTARAFRKRQSRKMTIAELQAALDNGEMSAGYRLAVKAPRDIRAVPATVERSNRVSAESSYLCLWRAFHNALLIVQAAESGDADEGCKEVSELFQRFQALSTEALDAYLADCPPARDAELPSLEISGYSWHHVMLEAVRVMAVAAMWSIRGAGERSLHLAKEFSTPSDVDAIIADFERDRLRHWPAIAKTFGGIVVSTPERKRICLRVAQESDEMHRRAAPATPAPASPAGDERSGSNASAAQPALGEFALSEKHQAILFFLEATKGTAVDQYAIADAARFSRNTVGKLLKELREHGLTWRPHGENSGEAITTRGLERLESLRAASRFR
jgi:hypothetical protein